MNPLPSWQKGIVPQSVNPNHQIGRGVPDVCGDADPASGYQIFYGGQPNVVGGTSAVAPLWAGLIARINQKLGTPVGFFSPLLYSKLGPSGSFHDIIKGHNDTTGHVGGYSAGKGWDEFGLPAGDDTQAYALEIAGDQMQPVYRDGDVLVVSPATPIRRGDRVVLKTRTGELMVRELKRRTAKTLELRSLNGTQPDRTLAPADVAWIARIVWASQ